MISREVLERRRARVEAAWKKAGLDHEIVMICAGEPIGIPGGADQTYSFIAHSDYFYLTGRDEPSGVLCYDVDKGWRHFIPEVSEGEQVWEGKPPTDWSSIGDDAEDLSRLAAYVAARRWREIITLGSTPSGVAGVAWKNARMGGVALRELHHARRVKDDHEIAEIRRAIDITLKAFAHARPFIKPGVTERQIQIELEAEMFRIGGAGVQRTAYGTIVGTGSNSAVLHFAPGDRVVKDGDFVLIDAGAEYRRYAADVTRTYSGGGTFKPHQRELFDVVRRAQQCAIQRCVVGAEWKDIHLATAIDMVEGLVAMGLMKGSPANLVERDAHTLFFPHGLGHMVGLGVRDASGMLPGRQKSSLASLATLRMDLPLEAGYVVTVEPGLYFIPAIVHNPERRQKFADCVDWSKVDWWMSEGGGGGVRLEENVLIRSGQGPEVLTSAIPHE